MAKPPRRESAPKAQITPKSVELDTITTRFLMLFIIVLVIPLFSMIIFTQNLLKNQLDNAVITQFLYTDAALLAKLQEKRQIYRTVLDQFGTSASQDLQTLCQENTKKVCLKIDFNSQQVTFADQSKTTLSEFLLTAPDFNHLHTVSRENQPSFYSIWNNQLFMFNLFRQDDSGQKWIVLGTPIDSNLLSELYRQHPTLTMGTWIIGDPITADEANWLAQSPIQTSRFLPNIEKGLITTLQHSFSTQQETIEVLGNPFRISQKPIYNINHERIARIVTILPLTVQEDILANYHLGTYLIGVASLVFSVIIAILASRTITQPTLKFVDQVISLSNSRDLSSRVTVKGVHEINMMGVAFNRLLDQLENEHQMKDEFVATLTHDLKVPLLAEKQTLEYMNKGTYGELNESQSEIIEILQSANHSNLDLVNGLLEIYRYESNQVQLVFERVDVCKLLEETSNELLPLATEKHITLKIENPLSPERKAPIWADKLEIKRVLTNLIGNAITNTPKYGQITCLLADRKSWGTSLIYRVSPYKYTSLAGPVSMDNRIMVSIRDSGIGFSSDDLPQLFKQFAANKGRNPMSIGLGLYNCYQVVGAHGGDIWVETTEGEGSAVNFVLPSEKPKENES